MKFVKVFLLSIFIFCASTKAQAIVYWGVGAGPAILDGEGENDTAFPFGLKLGLKAADVFFEFFPQLYFGWRGADYALAFPGVIGFQFLQFAYFKGTFGGIYIKSANAKTKPYFGGGFGLRAPGPGMTIFFEADAIAVRRISDLVIYQFLVGLEFAI